MHGLSVRQAVEIGRDFAKTGRRMILVEFLIYLVPVWVLVIAVAFGILD